MRVRRKGITVFLATLVCVLALLVVFLNTFINKNRERIREEIEKHLGRSLRFDQLQLSFWGGIGILAKHLSIAEDPRFAATPFIQTKELKMQLRWLPLLMGDIVIKKFVLDEPEIQIIKNEEGVLNLSALKGPGKRAGEGAKETREAKEEKKRAAVSLLPSAIYVTNGRVDYIDRSSKEPVEIRARNVNLDLKGLDLSGTTKVKFSASLFEGQGQNVGVEGLIGPLQSERNWTQHPLDLQVHFDSLLLPQLSRSIPFLRAPLSPYLGTTGPLMLQAKLLGSLERPRISNLIMTGAAFGSVEPNTTVKGELDFSKGSSWREGEIQVKINVDPVSLEELKKIPFLKQSLPASLSSEGPWSVASELQGGRENFQVHALIKARESEIRYRDWLKKGKGIPAEMEIRAARQKDRLAIEESSFTLHNLKLKFSGLLEESPEQRLTLQLRSNDIDLSGWEKLLPPLSSFSTGGILQLNLSLNKNLALLEGGFDIRGALTIDGLQAKDKKSARGIEKVTARVTFQGKEARIEKGEGAWDGIPLANLNGNLAWLANGFSFKNLSFQALGGTLRANGAWESRPDGSQRLTLEPTIEAMDLKALLSQKFPNFKDQIEGQLNVKARLWGESKNGAALQDSLQGEGTAQVRGGSLKNYNLVERVLTKITGLPGVPNLISSRMPTRYNTLFQRRDTLFETLGATFSVQQGRIYSEDLHLATPDYSISAEGWVGFDKTMKWNATLAMSPQFTRDLMQEHRNVRYMVDRQGRLAVPFRLEGTLPYVQAKPDLQGLAETIQRGLLQRGVERALGGEKDENKKGKRDWIQKGLEQLFGK